MELDSACMWRSWVNGTGSHSQVPRFSIHFTSMKPKIAAELSDEPQPVHNKTNIKLNTSICWYFVNITCKKSTGNLKLSGTERYWAVLSGTRWRSWLKHCAASRKVAGSIIDEVTGIFHWHNPSGRTMALGLTQPLTEISARNIYWGVKAAGA